MSSDGSHEGNAVSTLDAIPRVLKFLSEALGENARTSEPLKPAQ